MSASVTRRAPAAPRTSASPDVVSRSAAPRGAGSGAWLRERGMGATVLVAAISTAFGVLLLSATGYIGA